MDWDSAMHGLTHDPEAGAETAMKCLTETALSGNAEQRLQMVRQLGVLATSAAIAPLAVALADPAPAVRREAQDRLCFLDPKWHCHPSAISALPHLQRARVHANYWVRQAAADAAAKIARLRQPLSPRPTFSQDPITLPSTHQILAEGARDPDRNLRLACAEALARQHTPEAHSALQPFAKDADHYVRSAAKAPLAGAGLQINPA